MAYINTQDVAKIRNALKIAFPDFKFSVRKQNGGLSVDVAIVSGPIDLSSDIPHGNGYAQLNPYYLERYEWTKFYEAVDMVVRLAPSKKYYNNSDAMTDYFDVAFYYHINVGAWNKPYEVKFPKKSKGVYQIPDFNSEAKNALAITELAA